MTRLVLPLNFTMTDKIKWKSVTTVGEMEQLLHDLMPLGSSLSFVRRFGALQGLECSDVIKDLVRCSAPAGSNLRFVRAKWLIELTFDKDCLTHIKVSKGLIGP